MPGDTWSNVESSPQLLSQGTEGLSGPARFSTDSAQPDRPKAQFRSDMTVELVKASASDADVVFAARVSTKGEQSLPDVDAGTERAQGLINFLLRERHGSPTEHNSMTFFVRAPIFVFREFQRHRVGFCLAGETSIDTGHSRVRLRDLYRRWHPDGPDRPDGRGPARRPPATLDQALTVLNEDTLLFERGRIGDVIESGVQEVSCLRTADGRLLRCTRDHAIFTNEGWIKAGDLEPTHLLAVAGGPRLPRRGTPAGATFLPFDVVGRPSETMTYDVWVDGPWHNFVANGIVVHNSYNEESGRYRQLEPVFYVPGPDRDLVQEGKPGHYEFRPGTAEQHQLVTEVTERSCQSAYDAYLQMLGAGVAREVARGVLPVCIYSSMYVTCNARSLMSLLSLRTKRPDAHFPSYPQREIEMVAERMEREWARLMPMTYDAFNANGRVSP